MSKVQKFCNLYVFVKKENPELFEILEDMCAIGLFTSRHPVTFINPSKEITESLVDLINKGKVDTAFEHLQKHFIYGKHTSLSKGPFVTYNQKMMKTDLSKNTKANKVFTQWKSDNVAVFDQTGSSPLEEGDQTERPKIDKKKGGSSGVTRTKEEITEILQERSKNANNMHAFAYAVNGLLSALEDDDSDKFKEVKHKLDPNPVVCWYILVKPSAESKYISNELFSEWASTFDININNKNVAMLKSAFECDDYGSSHIAKAREARNKLNDSGLKNLVDSIVSNYDETELIEDELRFRFTDYTYEEIALHFSELDNLTWSLEDAILCKTNNSLLCKPIYETVKRFVESNCFHYTMYDQSTHKKFEEFIQGAGASSKKIIKILGADARKLITTLKAEDELAKLVSSLSKKQIASLKKILKA